jgi:hypothetical protein
MKNKMSRKSRTKYVCDECPKHTAEHPDRYMDDGDEILKGCILYFEEDDYNIPRKCIIKCIEWDANWVKKK